MFAGYGEIYRNIRDTGKHIRDIRDMGAIGGQKGTYREIGAIGDI